MYVISDEHVAVRFKTKDRCRLRAEAFNHRLEPETAMHDATPLSFTSDFSPRYRQLKLKQRRKHDCNVAM